MDWSYKLKDAPRGELVKEMIGKNEAEVYKHEKILTASKCGKIIVSCWLPKSKRWEFYSKDSPPIAWMPMPCHPNDLK